MVRIGNSTWRYGVWSVACFPARVLQVVACSGRNKGYFEVII